MTGCFAGFRIDGRRKMISKSLVEGLLFLEKVFFVEVFGVQAHPRQVEVEAVASLFTAYSETVPWMTVGRSATTAFSPDGPLQS
ncbi:transport inhibitor response 1-like protein [Musa troglodytarum]|uniref:Transport inhibitor response 1-like protein n=1 Tax=Musa troglodytarum TaxID=320322 RepID=A0A9E7GV60_9LILI|nr:transport inhibitor response 1-like protein [Musa troglodytarum]